MSSQIPIDIMLDALADDVWRDLVLQFLQFHPPAAINTDSQNTLGNLVEGFLVTSQDINMQDLMVALDIRYNLAGRGLIIASVMQVINTNVANHRRVLLPQPLPATIQPLQPAVPSDTIIVTHTLPPATLQTPPLPPPQPQPVMVRRRHKFPEIELKFRQRSWYYVCDLCGYKAGCRGDFGRHMRVGAQRAGFQIYKVDPLNDPHWYARDDEGTEHNGDVVVSTLETKGQKIERPRLSPPCGPPIREAERARKQELARKK